MTGTALRAGDPPLRSNAIFDTKRLKEALQALRRVVARFGLLRYVWHPALFVAAVYMSVLSSMVLVAGR